MFQHTAARRRLLMTVRRGITAVKFQHTAARRRLLGVLTPKFGDDVSTHSRPKAAGQSTGWMRICWPFQHTAARRRLFRAARFLFPLAGFNTQPPEGGCECRQPAP